MFAMYPESSLSATPWVVKPGEGDATPASVLIAEI